MNFANYFSKQAVDSKLAGLVETAISQGTAAKLIPANGICAQDDLAKHCQKPKCENYGTSMSCPPHVAGPAAFRQLLKQYSKALVFKLEVPTDILFTDDRKQVFQLLHEIAAKIETDAIDTGFKKARAYAGGSCKKIFCHDQRDCLGIAAKETCRHPGQARPSMSGFGINVAKLIEAAEWPKEEMPGENKSPASKISGLYGLVLID